MGIPIHFGTKRVDKWLGFVADFCPICREVRAFRLMSASEVRHFNLIPLGEGVVIDHYIQCTDCASRFWLDPKRYSGTEKDREQNEAMLVSRTFPEVYNAYRERLALEVKVKSAPNSLSSVERQELLTEPFLAMESSARERLAVSNQFDVPSSIGCLGSVLLTGGLFFFSAFYLHNHPREQDRALIAMLVVGAVGLAYTFLRLHLAPARYVNKVIGSKIARTLHGLNPTKTELEDVLQKCRDRKLVLAEKLKINWLWSAVEKVRK